MKKFVSRQLTLLVLVVLAAVGLAGCSLPGEQEFSGLEVRTTNGADVQIYLDELHLGQSPLEKRDIQPGTYTLRLEPSSTDQQPYETQIHLYPKTMTSVVWSFDGSQPSGNGEILELEPLASDERAELSVITVPEGAKISLDTQSYGLSPVVVDNVDPGQYTLSVDAVAHNKKAFTINIQPGYRLHVFARLTKEDAALQVDDSVDAAEDAESPNTNDNLEEVLEPSDRESSDAARRSLPTPKPSASPSPQPSQNPEKPYVLITETGTGWLRVRDQASSAGQEVARVDVGGKYPYISTLNGWYEIEYSPGNTGWISGQYADIIR